MAISSVKVCMYQVGVGGILHLKRRKEIHLNSHIVQDTALSGIVFQIYVFSDYLSLGMKCGGGGGGINAHTPQELSATI